MLLKQWLINQIPALGAGGRRFESSRPDHYHQGLMASAVSPFCVGLALGLAFEGFTSKLLVIFPQWHPPKPLSLFYR